MTKHRTLWLKDERDVQILMQYATIVRKVRGKKKYEATFTDEQWEMYSEEVRKQ